MNAFLLYREAKSADVQLVDFKLHVALGLVCSKDGTPDDCSDLSPVTDLSTSTTSPKASVSGAAVGSKRAQHEDLSVRHDKVGHWPVKVALKKCLHVQAEIMHQANKIFL